MSELNDSLNTTFTAKLVGKEYEISHVTMGIWGKIEAEAEAWSRETNNIPADVENAAKLPLSYIQTTSGGLSLIAKCLTKAGTKITPEELGDSLTMKDLTSVMNIITTLIEKLTTELLPGEDDGTGNSVVTA